MQTGRRGGRASLLAGIDRLVAVVVLQLRRNVGRQGHQTHDVQDLINVLIFVMVVFKADEAIALLDHTDHLADENTATEHHTHAHTGALTRLDQRLPGIQLVRAKQEQFDLGILPAFGVAVQTGGNDLGIVDDQRVALLQIIQNIVKMPMLQRVRVAMHDHQAAVITRLDRMLGNTLLGQIVIKIRGGKRRCGTLVDNGRHEAIVPLSDGSEPFSKITGCAHNLAKRSLPLHILNVAEDLRAI